MAVTVETILSVDPEAVERARRLDHAIGLLRAGEAPTDVRRLVRARYEISVATAWRIVEAARDMVEVDR